MPSDTTETGTEEELCGGGPGSLLECPIRFSEYDGLVWRMTTGDNTFLINRGDSKATIPKRKPGCWFGPGQVPCGQEA